ncbi:MAG: hypothetical protein IPK15_09935 [Verrucomicrobia bacterium]|nr:hypothetical protein [Verrucomicrobiota bacterium]
MKLAVLAVLVLFVVGGFYVQRRSERGWRRVEGINTMSSLKSAYSELREHGTFTNHRGNLRIYPFTNHYVVGGVDYQCVLAAEAPRFRHRGLFTITTNEVIVWIEHTNGAIPLLSPFTPPPLPPGF